MSTGSWTTGPETTNTHTHGMALSGFASSKTWSGADGRTLPDGRSQWNAYTMRHRRARINGTPVAGFHDIRQYRTWFGSVEYRQEGWPVYMYTRQTVPFFSGFSDQWGLADEYRLLAKLLAKVKGHSFNVGVSLAEVDKTASHMVSTVKQLAFAVNDLASGRFTAAARRFGTYPPDAKTTRKMRTMDISGRFLELRYAWTPVIQDAFAVGKAFEALSNGPRSKLFRVTGKKEYEDTYGPPGRRISRSRTYMYEAYEELGALRQMGLANPASILWERIPYSFVLDWFIPVGTYLELIGQVPFLEGRFLRTDFATSTHVYTANQFAQDPNEVEFLAGPESVSVEHTQIDRTPLDSLSVPLPTFKVEGAVQGKRLQNAIALGHQLFGNAADFFGGKPVLRKGRVNYIEDATAASLMQRLRRL